jgi:hypothetical protein
MKEPRNGPAFCGAVLSFRRANHGRSAAADFACEKHRDGDLQPAGSEFGSFPLGLRENHAGIATVLVPQNPVWPYSRGNNKLSGAELRGDIWGDRDDPL